MACQPVSGQACLHTQSQTMWLSVTPENHTLTHSPCSHFHITHTLFTHMLFTPVEAAECDLVKVHEAQSTHPRAQQQVRGMTAHALHAGGRGQAWDMQYHTAEHAVLVGRAALRAAASSAARG